MKLIAKNNHLSECKLLRVAEVYELSKNGMLLQLTNGRALSSSCHNHEFYEIICVLIGSCMHLIDGEEYLFEAGDVAFIRPGSYHLLYRQTPDTNILALSVKTEIMRSFLEAYDISDENIKGSLGAESLQLVRRSCLKASFSDSSKSNHRIRLILGQLVAYLSELGERDEKKLPKSFEALLLRVRTPEAVAEGVGAFVRLSNFSYPHLCRLTKQYLGMSPGEYMTQLRLQLAHEMLVCTSEPYEDICERVGFSSMSHFTKLIKKHYGMTPAKIRRRNTDSANTV